MTPSARTQAAIELLDQIIAAARESGAAADTLIARYFATRRYAGSKDRRAVRELVYAAIRTAGDRPENGRAAMLLVADADPALAATFDGSTHAPAPIGKDEPRARAGVAPQWLTKALRASGLDGAALTDLAGRATLDLRVDYLRPATPGRTVIGRGECLKVTRSIAFVRGIAYDETPDDPLAHVAGTFMLMDALA